MTSKRKIARADLVRSYNEQWVFLRRSCEAFDGGDESEAKRLASTLRLLVHDTRRSHSLLAQLGLKEALFFDTSENIHEDNLLPTFGLVQARFGGSGSQYVAPLARPSARPVWMIPFEYWWTKRVIRVPEQFELTRADLVLTMANQDGGVHVDSEVEDRYYRLTRENALGFTFTDAAGVSHPFGSIETASVRQIAHEFMVSLITPRRMIPPELPASEPPKVIQVTTDARTGETRRSVAPVRNMCPCNSGLEYHQCHARGGANEGKLVKPRVT